MTDPISSKESCRIGTWNVRTINESTKTEQIVREMTSHNLGILGIVISLTICDVLVDSFIVLTFQVPILQLSLELIGSVMHFYNFLTKLSQITNFFKSHLPVPKKGRG